MEKYNLKDNTVTESDLKKNDNFPTYPRDSIITTDKELVNLDKGSMGGTRGTYFYIKDNADSMSHAGSAKRSFYYDSFGGYPDKFLLQQLPKPTSILNFKIQDIDNKLCVYCLYFFYLIERLDDPNAILKIYFV